MGGSGSGIWCRSDSKRTTEGQYSIDIHWLKKHGYHKVGDGGTLTWSWRDDLIGLVEFRFEEDRLILFRRQRPSGESWGGENQTVYFDRTPCHFGGYRKWFLCTKCSRRVAILFGVEKFFHCRICNNLTYASQQQNKVNRLISKAQKIRLQLGGEANLLVPFPWKPKNMHWKTYWHLREKAESAFSTAAIIDSERLKKSL